MAQSLSPPGRVLSSGSPVRGDFCQVLPGNTRLKPLTTIGRFFSADTTTAVEITGVWSVKADKTLQFKCKECHVVTDSPSACRDEQFDFSHKLLFSIRKVRAQSSASSAGPTPGGLVATVPSGVLATVVPSLADLGDTLQFRWQNLSAPDRVRRKIRTESASSRNSRASVKKTLQSAGPSPLLSTAKTVDASARSRHHRRAHSSLAAVRGSRLAASAAAEFKSPLPVQPSAAYQSAHTNAPSPLVVHEEVHKQTKEQYTVDRLGKAGAPRVTHKRTSSSFTRIIHKKS